MQYLVKLFTIVELKISVDLYNIVDEAQAKLDAFREATLPSENYGVTLYRATPDDLSGDLLGHQVEITPLSDEPDDALD